MQTKFYGVADIDNNIHVGDFSVVKNNVGFKTEAEWEGEKLHWYRMDEGSWSMDDLVIVEADSEEGVMEAMGAVVEMELNYN